MVYYIRIVLYYIAVYLEIGLPRVSDLGWRLGITQSDISRIEKWIDEVDADNDPIASFILPGGCELASRLHLARTVCRRAERNTLALHRSGGCSKETIILLNRTGDLLFALARSINKMAGLGDVPWQPRTEED